MRAANLPSRLLLVACLALLAACQTTTQTVVKVDPRIEPGSQPVQVSRAVSVFNDVCGASLPNFNRAPQRMARHGLTNRAATGTVFSPKENMSVKVLPGPGIGKTCSLVFASTAPPPAALKTLQAAYGPLVSSPLGLAAPYPGRRTVVLFVAARSEAKLHHYNLRLLSER